MTDLTEAIAAFKADMGHETYGLQHENDFKHIILNAVASGELIPATERDAAVAAALEDAGKAVPQEPPYATAESQIEHGRVIGYKDAADDARSAILALINQPQAAALARVRADAVKIKPLVWVESPDREYQYSAAIYEVQEIGLGVWWLSIGGVRRYLPFKDCRAAKAAAQADALARVRADAETTFMAAVWDALKADANDLRKQQRILEAFRAAIGGVE